MKRTITDFFCLQPKKKTAQPAQSSTAAQPAQSSTVATQQPTTSTSAAPVEPTHIENDSPSYDVGAVEWSKMSDMEKVCFLTKPWCPPTGFQWPYTERKDRGNIRQRYLGPQHFAGKYDMFSYSLSKKGIFCRPCAIFAPDEVGGVRLNRMVKTPLQKYDHLTGSNGYLTEHLSKKFHEDSLSKANAFVALVQSNAGDVEQQANIGAAKKREKNRRALERIVSSIEFLGRLGLALRGHRDSGDLLMPQSNSSEIDYTQGNFRATLQFMASCNDKVIYEHISTAGRNSTYISPRIQNDLLEAIGVFFQKRIVHEVKEARFFSLLADETTDVSIKEQLTICLRYVRDDSICERFFAFREATDLTGGGLAAQLLATLTDAGIPVSGMVGQGYDGAAAMSGHKSGVQKHIRERCPAAMYVHCISHCLNLCLMKAGQVTGIKKAVTLMHEIAVFYQDSNKRTKNLQEAIEQKCKESGRSRLKNHCATRWVEKQEAVRVFKQLLPALWMSLDDIASWPGNASGKALLFTSSLNGEFAVALHILTSVLEVTKPLSVRLQEVAQDIHHACESVRDCITTLQQMRTDETFEKIFEAAEEQHGERIEMSRINARQTNRENHPAQNAEEYYRRSMYFPYLDVCLEQLRERFTSQSVIAYALSSLLPSFVSEADARSLRASVQAYDCFIEGGSDGFEAELMRWQAYWARQPAEQRSGKVLDALKVARKLKVYPIIETLLHIFATLPVTTASGERSFSALKLIKTYLRSRMKEDRLYSLAHLYINRDINLDHDQVIDQFAKSNRRLNLK